jgi:protease I
LCWAGQGITDKERGYRAAPSAWAAYPIDLYLVMPDGLFVYRPEGHSLEQVQTGDLRQQLSKAVGQVAIAEAACDIVIAGSSRKLAPKSGNKAGRFLMLEAGHVAENIQLQAVTLGLASVPVGDFETKNVARVCGLSGDLEPLLVVCVGHPLALKEQSQSSATAGVAAQRAVLIVPGVNYSDVELFETRRILTQAGLETVIAGPKIGPLQGAQGGLAASEVTLDGVRVADFDAVVFIGGPGAVAYFNNPAALGIAREAAVGRKVVAAIDNAPTILAAAGLLNGIRATSFLTQRDFLLNGGAIYTGTPVERDGSIITASSPAAVVPFAQAIVGSLRERQARSGKVP